MHAYKILAEVFADRRHSFRIARLTPEHNTGVNGGAKPLLIAPCIHVHAQMEIGGRLAKPFSDFIEKLNYAQTKGTSDARRLSDR